MALAPKPIVLTRVASLPAGSKAPQPFAVVGDLPVVASNLTAVPASFADLAALRTYLNTLVTELKASPYFN